MKTEKRKLKDYFRAHDFHISPVLQHRSITPHYRITSTGAHTLITSICCCIYGGSNVPEGGLGCVTFYYSGLCRYKYQKNGAFHSEILKLSEVYTTAIEAVVAFEQWKVRSEKTLASWKTII